MLKMTNRFKNEFVEWFLAAGAILKPHIYNFWTDIVKPDVMVQLTWIETSREGSQRPYFFCKDFMITFQKYFPETNLHKETSDFNLYNTYK